MIRGFDWCTHPESATAWGADPDAPDTAYAAGHSEDKHDFSIS
jgi:hypothetical protein